MYAATFLCAALTNFDERSAGIPKALMQSTGMKFSLGFLETIYGLW